MKNNHGDDMKKAGQNFCPAFFSMMDNYLFAISLSRNKRPLS